MTQFIEEELEFDEELGEQLAAVLEETEEESEAALPEKIVKKIGKAKRGKTAKSSASKEKDNPHAALDQMLSELAKSTDMVAGRATTEVVKPYIHFERSTFGMANLNALTSETGRPEDGGLPHGRFTVFTGPESACKTTLAMDVIAHRLLLHEDEYALIIDAENSVSPEWCAHFGVPMDRIIVVPGTSPLEDMATHGIRILRLARKKGIKISMCLIDSLGSMAPAVEMEGKKSGRAQAEVDIRTDHVATSARKINQMLRVWAPEVLKSGVCCIMIAHMMTDIGGYGGLVMKGGLGLRYFNHFTIRLNRKNDTSFDKEILCRDGEIRKIRTGYYVVATLVKSKAARYEGHKVALPFMVGVGFQTMMALLNSAVGFDIIEKKGSWFKYDGEAIGQGQIKAIKWLEENPEKRIQIENALSAAMYEQETQD